MSGNFKFFQGQGIVREFHIVSGKNEFVKMSGNCQGILHFSPEVKEGKEEIFFFNTMN